MPRCQNGTRRIPAKTGKCVKTVKNKVLQKEINQLDLKYAKWFDAFMIKFYKLRTEAEQLNKLGNEIDRLRYKNGELNDPPKLTEEEIEFIVRVRDIDDVDVIKDKLRNLKFDNDYTSCFDGEHIRDFYRQAADRLDCMYKYGKDEL